MKILLHPLFLLLAPYAIDAIHVTNDGPPENQPAPVTLEPDSDRFIVRYKNDQGKSSAKAAAQKVHVDLEPQNALGVTLSSEALEGLQNNPNIEYVEQDSPRYTMMMPGYEKNTPNNNETHGENHRRLIDNAVPYGIPMVQADQVSYDSSNPRTVCIIDTGYNLGHEDLPSTPNVNGYDGRDLMWSQDGRGHGTHIAGTIAANSVNGVVGVVPGVNLFIVRVFDDNGAWTYASSLVNAANKCKTGGANVISMSLGHLVFSSTENRAFADLYSSNILIVAAAGNSGDTEMIYPASYDSVVSVAAVDSDKNVPSFSQRNAQVEIAAPGVSILSTAVMGTGSVQNNYNYKSGTSMATPHVSGVAALIWSHDATKTASEVRAALQSGAQDLGDGGRDDSSGYGLVQAAAACATLTGSSCAPRQPSPSPTLRPSLSTSPPSPSPTLPPSPSPTLRPSLSTSLPSPSPSEEPSLAPVVSRGGFRQPLPPFSSRGNIFDQPFVAYVGPHLRDPPTASPLDLNAIGLNIVGVSTSAVPVFKENTSNINNDGRKPWPKGAAVALSLVGLIAIASAATIHFKKREAKALFDEEKANEGLLWSIL